VKHWLPRNKDSEFWRFSWKKSPNNGWNVPKSRCELEWSFGNARPSRILIPNMETDQKTYKIRWFVQNSRGETQPILVTRFLEVYEQSERDAASHLMLLQVSKESRSMTSDSKPCDLRITANDKHHEVSPRMCELRLRRRVVTRRDHQTLLRSARLSN
jgi:hypothetical protein